MVKRMVEIDDTLQERVDGAIEAVKEEFERYCEENEPEEVPDMGNDLDYSGAIHEIIDGSVPIYTSEIDDTWYLYSSELEEAYENAGIGSNPRENNGMVAIYCYIQQQVNAHYEQEGEHWLAEWKSEECNKWIEKILAHRLVAHHDRWLSGVSCCCESSSMYWLPIASYGDYSGSLVEKTNQECLLEEFDVFNEAIRCEGYGSNLFVLLLDCKCKNEDNRPLEKLSLSQLKEFYEQLEWLERYPLLSGDKHSELEMNAENEAWEDWGRKEFQEALEKHFGEEWIERHEANSNSGAYLDDMWQQIMETGRYEWLNEQGESVYIDVEKTLEDYIKRGGELNG